MHSLLKVFPSLQDLNLHNCDALTKDTFTDFGESVYENLQVLDIERCDLGNYAVGLLKDFQPMFTAFPNLRVLKMLRISSIASYPLIILKLIGSKSVFPFNASIVELALDIDETAHIIGTLKDSFPNLKILSLRGCITNLKLEYLTSLPIMKVYFNSFTIY